MQERATMTQYFLTGHERHRPHTPKTCPKSTRTMYGIGGRHNHTLGNGQQWGGGYNKGTIGVTAALKDKQLRQSPDQRRQHAKAGGDTHTALVRWQISHTSATNQPAHSSVTARHTQPCYHQEHTRPPNNNNTRHTHNPTTTRHTAAGWSPQ